MKTNTDEEIGNAGDRIYPNANGRQCARIIPNEETLGTIFRTRTRKAEPTDGAKMDCLALPTASAVFASVWRYRMFDN